MCLVESHALLKCDMTLLFPYSRLRQAVESLSVDDTPDLIQNICLLRNPAETMPTRKYELPLSNTEQLASTTAATTTKEQEKTKQNKGLHSLVTSFFHVKSYLGINSIKLLELTL